MGKRKRPQGMTQQAGTAAGEPRAAFHCPACNQQVLNWPVFAKHLQRCCPDLMQGRDLLLDGAAGHCAAELPEAVAQALQAAAAQEEELRAQLVCYPRTHQKDLSSGCCEGVVSQGTVFGGACQLELTFRGTGDDGERLRRDAPDVAQRMGLPLARVELMLHRALRAIPLVADKDPVVVRHPAALLHRHSWRVKHHRRQPMAGGRGAFTVHLLFHMQKAAPIAPTHVT